MAIICVVATICVVTIICVVVTICVVVIIYVVAIIRVMAVVSMPSGLLLAPPSCPQGTLHRAAMPRTPSPATRFQSFKQVPRMLTTP
jgi:hypothetical protein